MENEIFFGDKESGSFLIREYKAPFLCEEKLVSSSFQLLYCQRGTLSHKTDCSASAMTHGDMFIVPPKRTHSLEIIVPETYYYALSFCSESIFFMSNEIADFLSELSELESIPPKITLPPDEIVFVESILRRMQKESEKNEKYRESVLGGSLLSLVSVAAKYLPKKTVGSEADPYGRESFISYCISYIDAHCEEQGLSLSNITKLSAMSKSLFCKLFKSKTGLSFGDYLNRKRIQKALSLIKSGMKITEVAYASGYNEFSAFYRNFVKFTSTSPAAYKKTLK